MNRKAAAWTNQWLRELSWREIVTMRRLSQLQDWSAATSLQRHRIDRLDKEWKRRKQEGHGGSLA